MKKMYYLCTQKSEDGPRINLTFNVMVHYYEFCKHLPNARRKLIAAFVHELKKLCSRHHLHVNVALLIEEVTDHDFVSVRYSINDTTINEIKSLCARYGFGKDYISEFEDIDNAEFMYIDINLTKPWDECKEV